MKRITVVSGDVQMQRVFINGLSWNQRQKQNILRRNAARSIFFFCALDQLRAEWVCMNFNFWDYLMARSHLVPKSCSFNFFWIKLGYFHALWRNYVWAVGLRKMLAKSQNCLQYSFEFVKVVGKGSEIQNFTTPNIYQISTFKFILLDKLWFNFKNIPQYQFNVDFMISFGWVFKSQLFFG